MDKENNTEGNEQDNVPDFDIIEEGTEEARKFEEEAQRKAAEGDDGEDEGDETLVSRREGEGQAQTEGAKRKKPSQSRRLREKLNEKDGLISGLQQQNKQMADRLAVIERRTGANEIAMLDKAITDARNLAANAELAHTTSLTQNDPNLVTQTMKEMYAFNKQVDDLVNLRNTVTTQRDRPPATDPKVARNVNAFMGRHRWFRPENGDEDSLIAKMLDDKVMEDGFDPRTQAYWTELERRISKRLPHRSGKKAVTERDDEDEEEEDDDVVDTRREREGKNFTEQGGKSHVSGSGQGRGGGNRVKIVLSRERVQALKDAGMWEDTEKRNKMIKQYQSYDRQNSSSR